MVNSPSSRSSEAGGGGFHLIKNWRSINHMTCGEKEEVKYSRMFRPTWGQTGEGLCKQEVVAKGRTISFDGSLL